MSKATGKQLKERWLTPEGQKLKKDIIKHIKEDDWEKLLLGFPFVEEVENGKDLRFINFEFQQLGKANLEKANLRNANLRNTNFLRANLIKANFEKADLLKAKFIRAYIDKAVFIKANLRGSNFWNAKLTRSDFRKANLEKADLRESVAWSTNFQETNLQKAKFQKSSLQSSNFKNSDLRKANFQEADLWQANLKEANLNEANFTYARLEEANLIKTNINKANFGYANLLGANLTETNCYSTNFGMVNLSYSVLKKANLINTSLFNCNLTGANICGAKLIGCYVYGISAWDIKISNKTVMKDLIIFINENNKNTITVDDIEIAQFINLIINNKKITNIITSMRTKAVLILGSFKKENKRTLNLIKQIVLKNKENYIPIVFDFNPPKLQTLTNTIRILSLLSRFTIIDITEPAGQLIELGQFNELRVPYAIILSDKAKNVPGTVENHVLTEWCYKKRLILYSADNKEEELDELINNKIALWAEGKNKRYKEVIIGFRKDKEEINKTLRDKNEKGGDKKQEL